MELIFESLKKIIWEFWIHPILYLRIRTMTPGTGLSSNPIQESFLISKHCDLRPWLNGSLFIAWSFTSECSFLCCPFHYFHVHLLPLPYCGIPVVDCFFAQYIGILTIDPGSFVYAQDALGLRYSLLRRVDDALRCACTLEVVVHNYAFAMI